MNILLAIVTVITLDRSWPGMGKRTIRIPEPEPILAVQGTVRDTTFIHRKTVMLPVPPSGTRLGDLEGVKCFNCTPGIIALNLRDSLEAQFTLTLRGDVWKQVPLPIVNRAMFDHDNKCFYFGYKDADTSYIAGEYAEVKTLQIPCFPYLQRTNQMKMASTPTRVEARIPVFGPDPDTAQAVSAESSR